MTYNVFSGTLNPTHLLTYLLTYNVTATAETNNNDKVETRSYFSTAFTVETRSL